MSKKASELLLECADLAADGFCKGIEAIDEDGKSISPKSRRAVCRCSTGCIKAVIAEESDFLMRKFFAQAVGCQPDRLEPWNDRPETTQVMVIEGFMEAADLAVAAGC